MRCFTMSGESLSMVALMYGLPPLRRSENMSRSGMPTCSFTFFSLSSLPAVLRGVCGGARVSARDAERARALRAFACALRLCGKLTFRAEGGGSALEQDETQPTKKQPSGGSAGAEPPSATVSG